MKTKESIVVSEDNFILVEAEMLSLKDEFMQYEPQTKNESDTKELIKEAIDKKVNNFYCPMFAPSFTDDGKNICFVADNIPITCKSYKWWTKVARKYKPECNSRIGTRLMYGAFLGFLMKSLVEFGKSITWVWNAVCNDSRELGHYGNSENAKLDLERTGLRGIYVFYDLGNTFKFLAEDEENGGFWLAGGCYCGNSNKHPIAKLKHLLAYRRSYNGCSSGWIVYSC